MKKAISMAGFLDKFSVLGIITYKLYAISDSVEKNPIKNSTISFIDTFISSNVEKLNTLTHLTTVHSRITAYGYLLPDNSD